MAVLEPMVRTKVAAFWAAASRIRDRLLTHYHQKRYRAFWHGVRVAQKWLRMWLERCRFKRTIGAAATIQHALRTQTVRHEYSERKARRDAAVKLQKSVRGWCGARATPRPRLPAAAIAPPPRAAAAA